MSDLLQWMPGRAGVSFPGHRGQPIPDSGNAGAGFRDIFLPSAGPPEPDADAKDAPCCNAPQGEGMGPDLPVGSVHVTAPGPDDSGAQILQSAVPVRPDGDKAPMWAGKMRYLSDGEEPGGWPLGIADGTLVASGAFTAVPTGLDAISGFGQPEAKSGPGRAGVPPLTGADEAILTPPAAPGTPVYGTQFATAPTRGGEATPDPGASMPPAMQGGDALSAVRAIPADGAGLPNPAPRLAPSESAPALRPGQTPVGQERRDAVALPIAAGSPVTSQPAATGEITAQAVPNPRSAPQSPGMTLPLGRSQDRPADLRSGQAQGSTPPSNGTTSQIAVGGTAVAQVGGLSQQSPASLTPPAPLTPGAADAPGTTVTPDGARGATAGTSPAPLPQTVQPVPHGAPVASPRAADMPPALPAEGDGRMPPATASATVPVRVAGRPDRIDPISGPRPTLAAALPESGLPGIGGVAAPLEPVGAVRGSEAPTLPAQAAYSAPAPTAAAMARQIVTATQTENLRERGGIDIALDPPELGRVRLSLVEVNGTISLSIATERPETAELMRRHIGLLAQEFGRLGLDAPSVDISQGGADGRSEGRGPPLPPDAAPGPKLDVRDPAPSSPLAAAGPRSEGLDLRL